LPVEQVREVLLTPAMTRPFRAAPFLPGIVNLRGEVVPVLDLSRLVGIPRSGSSLPMMLVVMELDEAVAALGSDEEAGVVSVKPNEITPPPSDLPLEALDCVVGILAPEEDDGTPGLILDGTRLLNLPPIRELLTTGTV
jgi:purine-binding chemotaxis protein CheW